jgi:hypothetical protein
MKKLSVIMLSLFVLVLLPVWALAGTVEGSVQGFTCVTQGKVCPVGKEDPMIAAERIFVILTKGGSYYFVPNLDRAILARHINAQVRVTGDVSAKYPSIVANKMEVFKKGAWKTTWTQRAQDEIREFLGYSR